MINKFGVLLLDKPQGKTSHDCVNMVRRALSLKRVGHTGTLDPMATGLLPICVGKATKLADMISGKDKEYRAGIIFGKTTDTMDITGELIEEKEVVCTNEEAKSAIMSFLGRSEQLPPMYSAKKINGRKLYELAREGKTAERKKTSIEITSMRIESIDMSEGKAEITVGCTKGTYIRVLTDDIGKKLGCGAVMSSLVRTKCGGFSLNDPRVVSEDFIKSASEEEILLKLIPADEILKDFKVIKLTEKDEERFKNGIRLKNIDLNGFSPNDRIAVFGCGGELIAEGGIFSEDKTPALGVLKSFY